MRCLLVLALTSVGIGAVPAGAQQPATAFVHVAVIPMDRPRVVEDQTVVVQGNRIVELGPAGRTPVPADAARVDGRGKYLMPGLADMHVHLWYEPIGAGDTMHVADALLAFVANGITTVRDMHSGGKDSWTLRLRHRVAAGDLLGPRIYTAADPMGEGIAAPTEALAGRLPAIVAELKAAGHDFVKFYGWGQPYYDSIVSAARRVGLRVVGHVPEGQKQLGLEQVLKDRWASTEHMWGYMEYLTGRKSRGRIDTPTAKAKLRAIAAETRRAGVWTCPTLSVLELFYSNLIGDRSEFVDGELQIVRALHQAGAGLLLGTDVPFGHMAPPGFAIHHELELLVEAGLTPYEALAAGTRDVARFLGTLDSTGTMAVGKRADLVLLKANPLENIRHTTALAGVMVAGHWLPRNELERRLDAIAPLPVDRDSVRYGTSTQLLRLARDLIWR